MSASGGGTNPQDSGFGRCGLPQRPEGVRARDGPNHYDTFTGRWTAPDPLGDAGGDPDLYGYCLDDPVNGVDPLGLFRFGKRPLNFLPDSWHWIRTDGSTTDKGNYKLKPGRGFHEGAFGDTVGLFEDVLRFDDNTWLSPCLRIGDWGCMSTATSGHSLVRAHIPSRSRGCLGIRCVSPGSSLTSLAA